MIFIVIVFRHSLAKNCEKDAYSGRWSNDFYMKDTRSEESMGEKSSFEELYARDLLDIEQIRSNEQAFGADE